MDRLMDAAHSLTAEGQAAVSARMDAFESQFPQLYFSTYIDALPDDTSLREFGFWLLNRAAVGSIDFSRPNENGILLIIDMNGRSAGLTVGYFLEEHLGRTVLDRSLAVARGAWARGHFHEGIIECIDHLAFALRKRARTARTKDLETASDGLPTALRSMREGHVHQTPEEHRDH